MSIYKCDESLCPNLPWSRTKLRKLIEEAADWKAKHKDIGDHPETSAKIKKARGTISTVLVVHYRTLRLLLPQLISEGGVNTQPKDPLDDPVTLPSSLPNTILLQPWMAKLREYKIQLCLGQARDALQKLRNALSYRSFLTRHSKSEGATKWSGSTRASSGRFRAHVRVTQWAAVYDSAWDALTRLGATPAQLGALQKLEKTDLTVLSEWLEDEQYRATTSAKGTPLPWIWRLSRLDIQGMSALHDPDGSTGTREELEKFVDDWNWEGTFLYWQTMLYD